MQTTNSIHRWRQRQGQMTAVAMSQWWWEINAQDDKMDDVLITNTTVPFKEWRLREKTVEDPTANNWIGAGFYGIWAQIFAHLNGKPNAQQAKCNSLFDPETNSPLNGWEYPLHNSDEGHCWTCCQSLWQWNATVGTEWKESTPTEPTYLDGTNATKKDKTIWDKQCSLFWKQQVQHKDKKAKVFATVCGQCDKAMKNWAEADSSCSSIESTTDVAALMKVIKEVSDATSHKALQGLMMAQQQNEEDLVDCCKRFMSANEMVKWPMVRLHHWSSPRRTW